MSYERSNNRGELVGAVVGARSLGNVKVRRGGAGGGRERLRNRSVAEVDIRLDKPVGKGDLLEVRPLSDASQFLTTHAAADADSGETITCRTVRPLEKGSLVRVIRSKEAKDAGERVANLGVVQRRAVLVRIRARLGEPFLVELAVADGKVSASAQGPVVEPARTRAVSKADLVRHVGRMGGTPFQPISFSVEMDEGCGMGFSAVHRVRADACDKLRKAILCGYAGRDLAPAPSRRSIEEGLAQVRGHAGIARRSQLAPDDARVCAVVSDPLAAMSALGAGATCVYAKVDDLERHAGQWPDGVIPLLDEVCREGDRKRLDRWVQAGLPVAVGNVSELAFS